MLFKSNLQTDKGKNGWTIIELITIGTYSEFHPSQTFSLNFTWILQKWILLVSFCRGRNWGYAPVSDWVRNQTPSTGSLNLWAVMLCTPNEGKWRWGGGRENLYILFFLLKPFKKTDRTKEECVFYMHDSLPPSDEVPQKLSFYQSWRDRIGGALVMEWMVEKNGGDQRSFYAEKIPNLEQSPPVHFISQKAGSAAC